MTAPSNEFDPGRYLTKVSGSDYLEVKWRLVWLRHAHPDAVIETDCVSFNESFAVFKAKVSIPGSGSAMGWGSEAYNDFRDYIEKAETKSLGRALAALGFGTQFCPDFEFGADHGRVVDAPVKPQNAPRDAQPRQQASRQGGTFYPATEKQIDTIKKNLSRLHGNPLIVDTLMSQGPGISKRDASAWIESLFAGTIPPALMADDGPPEPYEPADDTDIHNDSAQAEIDYAGFDARHPDLAAKHRQ